MRYRLAISILCTAVAMFAAGCGDESGPDDLPLEGARAGGDRPAVPGAINPFDLKNVKEFELTDEIMQKYFDLVKKMTALKDSSANPLTAFEESSLKAAEYQYILKQFFAGTAAAASSAARESTEKMLAQTDAQIESMKGRMAAMSGPAKEQVTAALEQMKQRREQFAKMLENMPAPGSVAAKNLETIKRWMPKFKEIKDKIGR